MEKQFISVLAILVIVLGTSGVVQADVAATFIDDFNEPHDYLWEYVWGTIWDDFVGHRECETVDELTASIHRPGQLFLEAAGTWIPPWCPLGPFLYKEVEGDFIATVKVTDYAGTEEEPVFHNTCGLMARAAIDPDVAGPGEDWVSIDYFPIWNCGNFVRGANDGNLVEWVHNGLAWDAHTHLQLERTGNLIILRTSADGYDWTEMLQSPIQRNDFDGLPLQVGLRQCTYDPAVIGYAAFDNFKLELIVKYKARNPVPADKARNQDPNVDLAWTPGDEAKTHDIYFGTDETAVLNASRPAGDVDGDGDVDWLDVFVVSQQWLQDPPSGSQPSADLDGDDDVDGFDFAIMAGDWAKQASDVFKGNQDNNSYYPGPLSYGTTYYWRINEVNTSEPGSPWTGDVWSFTVESLAASQPSPPHGAECVLRDSDLAWTPGALMQFQDIYFGTLSSPPLVKLNHTLSYYPLPTLDYNTTYYWMVNTKGFILGTGWVTWPGEEWSFTTVHQIPITDPNLVGWWKLDGASCQNIALDSSGYDQHGILVNGPQWVEGYDGGALAFDGVDDYVELPIGELIGSLTNSTFMIWMDSKPGGSWVRTFDFGTDDPNIYMCLGPRAWYMDEMYFAITLTDNLGQYRVQTTAFDLPSEWHHVAVTINADANTAILYYDGMEFARNENFPICPNDLGETINNWLGRSHDDADDYYLGSMADFRIYDYAITQEKVIEVIGE